MIKKVYYSCSFSSLWSSLEHFTQSAIILHMESSVLKHVHVITQMHLNAMPCRGCVLVIRSGRGRIVQWMLMSVNEDPRVVSQIFMFV